MSKIRRVDINEEVEDTMLAEMSESIASESIQLDPWLKNPSATNMKSCCERVTKKYFVGKGKGKETEFL